MITLTKKFPVSPQQLYMAWLTGAKHTAMTGSAATGTPEVGTAFTAWDGYICGTNRELEPYKKIVQSWRTTDFPTDAPDSTLTIEFEATDSGTKLTLTHTNTPKDQEDGYRSGWEEHYFAPMTEYFS